MFPRRPMAFGLRQSWSLLAMAKPYAVAQRGNMPFLSLSTHQLLEPLQSGALPRSPGRLSGCWNAGLLHAACCARMYLAACGRQPALPVLWPELTA
jgi:hypothetical protein